MTQYVEEESDASDSLVERKEIDDKESFMPGLVSQKTIREGSGGGEQRSPHEMLDGYKIETDLDRKLLLGVWEELKDAHPPK